MQLYDRLSKQSADDYALVLLSVGLKTFTVARSDAGWRIDVRAADYDRARAAIERYQHENRHTSVAGDETEKGFGWQWSGFWAALVIAALHVAVADHSETIAVKRVYAASAERIVSGEWYRATTALLLHVDGVHLLANMVGLIVFGSAASSVMGRGIGWLSILISGIGGNLLTAYFYGAAHSAVGASTAVFGAVGLLCTYQFIKRIHAGGAGIRAFLPFGAGLALLAFLGASGKTDVMAHLFGFAFGAGLGFLYPLVRQNVAKKGVQITALGLLSALIVLSCLAGFSRP